MRPLTLALVLLLNVPSAGQQKRTFTVDLPNDPLLVSSEVCSALVTEYNAIVTRYRNESSSCAVKSRGDHDRRSEYCIQWHESFGAKPFGCFSTAACHGLKDAFYYTMIETEKAQKRCLDRVRHERAVREGIKEALDPAKAQPTSADQQTIANVNEAATALGDRAFKGNPIGQKVFDNSMARLGNVNAETVREMENAMREMGKTLGVGVTEADIADIRRLLNDPDGGLPTAPSLSRTGSKAPKPPASKAEVALDVARQVVEDQIRQQRERNAAGRALDTNTSPVASTVTPSPKPEGGFLNEGKSALTQRNYPTAVAHLAEAVRVAPNCFDCWSEFAYALEANRDPDKAIEALNRASAIRNGRDPSVLRRLARIYNRLDHPKAADAADSGIRAAKGGGVGGVINESEVRQSLETAATVAFRMGYDERLSALLIELESLGPGSLTERSLTPAYYHALRNLRKGDLPAAAARLERETGFYQAALLRAVRAELAFRRQPPEPAAFATSASVTSPATPLGEPDFRTRVYPLIASSLRVEGTVFVRVTVGPDGVPQSAVIEKSIAFLDQEAAARALLYRFHPARFEGKPVTGSATLQITFKRPRR